MVYYLLVALRMVGASSIMSVVTQWLQDSAVVRAQVLQVVDLGSILSKFTKTFNLKIYPTRLCLLLSAKGTERKKADKFEHCIVGNVINKTPRSLRGRQVGSSGLSVVESKSNYRLATTHQLTYKSKKVQLTRMVKSW